MKKVLALLLTAVMLVCCFTVAVNAEDDIQCMFNPQTGSLVIIGEGDMIFAADEETGAYPWTSYATDIRSIRIDNGITTIGEFAFTGTTNLRNITIAPSVKTIGEGAFSYSAVETVVIPEGVETIEGFAFAFCLNLRECTIPSTVTVLGEQSFECCNSLQKLTVRSADLDFADSYIGIAEADFDENSSAEEFYDLITAYKIKEAAFMATVAKLESFSPEQEQEAYDYYTNVYEPAEAEYSAAVEAWNRYIEYHYIPFEEATGVEGLKIYGYANSTAETYADANGIEFVDLSTVAPDEPDTDTDTAGGFLQKLIDLITKIVDFIKRIFSSISGAQL